MDAKCTEMTMLYHPHQYGAYGASRLKVPIAVEEMKVLREAKINHLFIKGVCNAILELSVLFQIFTYV